MNIRHTQLIGNQSTTEASYHRHWNRHSLHQSRQKCWLSKLVYTNQSQAVLSSDRTLNRRHINIYIYEQINTSGCVFYPLPTDAHVSFHTHECMHKHTLISQPIPLSRRTGVPAAGASRWMMHVSYIVWMTHKVVNMGEKKKGAVVCVAAAVWFPGLHCTADMLEYCKGWQDLCHTHVEVTLKMMGTRTENWFNNQGSGSYNPELHERMKILRACVCCACIYTTKTLTTVVWNQLERESYSNSSAA